MVQYLYAAYSADVVIAAGTFPDAALWQQQVLTVAREEMGHLMTVQNALRLIGATPNWKREDIPWDGPYYPFPMEFEPFTFIAIEKYVYAEMDPSIDRYRRRDARSRLSASNGKCCARRSTPTSEGHGRQGRTATSARCSTTCSLGYAIRR